MKNTANYNFNLPEAEDYYNVDDFNGNFESIDTTLDFINRKSEYVTGVVSEAGSVILGWQPKAVFVMASGIPRDGSSAAGYGIGRVMAFAIPSYNQISAGSATETNSLFTTATGFSVSVDMFGKMLSTSASVISETNPLRYIAFK